MAKLHDVMAYLIANYPDHLSHELSNARLTKMVYLADWHQVLTQGRQITQIKWYFDNFGPFVRDVEQTADQRPDLFAVHFGSNSQGQPKKTIKLTSETYEPVVSTSEKASLDHIISIASKLYWAPFINLVYSTHPVASSQRYSYLDLAKKAQEYRATQ